jgi:2-keto-4-pentenoate hydratase/2-oxohepta-3-ene-1,7-dioic acid hydratase in catechol pathway
MLATCSGSAFAGAMRIARLQLDAGSSTYARQHPDGTFTLLEGTPFTTLTDSGVRVEGKLLAPVEPRAILCIGLNYRKHAEETKAPLPKFPVLFMKSPGAVQNPGDPIVLPRKLRSDSVDYECELAVVIEKAAKNVSKENALEYVLGYTCANDVSARDWQKEGGGGQWCRGKTFDTFCPLGPVIVTPDELPNPQALRISTKVNGEALQDWTTSDMIFDIPTLIEFLSASTTLLPGTVIITGTPHGVGMARTPQRWLQPGDVAEVEIEGIGVLRNPVTEEAI